MTTQELFAKALQFIKHHQDGEVAETLKHRGLQYNMIYGVSSSILYSFVKKEGKNQELANLLWKEDFREAKLMALMFAEAKIATNDELSSIIKGLHNHELVEIASLHFLPQLPDAVAKAKIWVESDQEFIKMTGYMLIRRIATNLNNVKAKELVKFLPHYEKDFASDSYFVRKAVVNSFQEVAYRKPGVKAHIEEATKRVLENNKGSEIELQANDMLQVLKYC